MDLKKSSNDTQNIYGLLKIVTKTFLRIILSKFQTFFKRIERLLRLHFQLHTSIRRSTIGQQDPRLFKRRKACYGSRCFKAKPLLGFDWTCFGVHQMHVNIKRTIVMAATVGSCSTAKRILQILHFYHRDFYKRFCREVLPANGGFHPK